MLKKNQHFDNLNLVLIFFNFNFNFNFGGAKIKEKRLQMLQWLFLKNKIKWAQNNHIFRRI
jgi:hypothetical protein